MKNLFKILFIPALLLALSSCKKFLDKQPYDQIGGDVALNSKDKIERAVTGAYNLLGQGNYYGFEWMNTVWLSDGDVVPFGAGTTDLQFFNHTVVASSNTIAINWQAMYQVVNQVNNVIDAIHDINSSDYSTEDRNNDLGQAYFLRGLVYFDLTRTFGDVTSSSHPAVPLVLHATRGMSANSYPARSTSAEVYTQVASDLDSAESLLTVSNNPNIATKRAATALKARLNLYLKDYEKASQFASQVISGPTYSLVHPFEKIITTKNTSEAIFEIAYSSVLNNPLSGVFLPTSMGGQYRVGPSNDIYSILQNPAIGGDRKVLVATDAAGNPYVNKYRSLATVGYSDDDVIVLRLAEMYLIRAEARANLDSIPQAVADLNIIKSRSNATLSTANNKQEVLLDIENERRVEFAFDPLRWFDLIRTNRAAEVIGLSDQNRYVFPIPSAERLANENLSQNPGY
ncbi:MAG: RagB/SusD family nutrient uptake outer membrane protein [Ginsengibacter sp.]